MTVVKRLLTPPVFEAEEKTHQAYLLHVILLALMLIPVPYAIYMLLEMSEESSRALMFIGVVEIINIIAFIMLRRGYVRQASVILIAALWLFLVVAAITSSSVYGIAYLLGNGLVITIAGILLGGRGALIIALLSIIEGGIMVYAELQGWVPPDILDTAFPTWIVAIVVFAAMASLQNLASREVRAALRRARASEERYRLISTVTSDYTFSTNLDIKGNMHLNWVAGAFKEITGYTYEEYVSAGGWLAHLHPDDVEKDAQALARLKSNQQVVHTIRTHTKAGDVQWVRVYAHPVWDKAQNRLVAIVGAVQDITRQYQAEEREKRRRVMLEKVVQLGKVVTEVKDLGTTLERIWHGVREDLGFDRVGIFIYNPERQSMDGTLGTDNLGEMTEEWDRWYTLSGVAIFTRLLEQPDGLYFTRQYDVEFQVAADSDMQGVKDYAAVAAWLGDKPVAIVCVDNVITNRPIEDEQLEALRLFGGYAGLAIENARLNDAIQAELAQRQQAEARELRRRAVLEEVVQLGKRVTEVADLRTTLERIWHGVHDDLGFDRLAIFLYNSERNSMDGSLGTDKQGQMVEEWDQSFPLSEIMIFTRLLETPDGLYFTHNYDVENQVQEHEEMYGVKDYAAVAAWAGDKPIAVICVDHFITQRRIDSEQLEALRLFSGYAGLAIENARLNAALQNQLSQRISFIQELEAKNSELERFTYTVSHDLKSPLVTITGFLGYLEKDALAGDAERIKGSIERITKAAEKMQALLNDLLELSRIGRIMNLPENIPFEEIVSEALEQVRGRLDAKQVKVQIQSALPVVYGDRARLVEVMQNLVDNSAKYSTPNARPCIEIGTKESDQLQTVFFVRDNGIGIDPKFHERIFGLFNKLDVHAEGTGIGLTLVKRIIEVHGGQIWVESEPGKGATFYFTLPNAMTKE